MLSLIKECTSQIDFQMAIHSIKTQITTLNYKTYKDKLHHQGQWATEQQVISHIQILLKLLIIRDMELVNLKPQTRKTNYYIIARAWHCWNPLLNYLQRTKTTRNSCVNRKNLRKNCGKTENINFKRIWRCERTLLKNRNRPSWNPSLITGI